MGDPSARIGLTRHVEQGLRKQCQLLLRKLCGFHAGVQPAHKKYFTAQIVSDPGYECLICQQCCQLAFYESFIHESLQQKHGCCLLTEHVWSQSGEKRVGLNFTLRQHCDL